MRKHLVANSKFTLLLLISIFLIGWQNINAAEPNVFELEFNLPEDVTLPPEQTRGASTINVLQGDIVNVSLKANSGPIMLIIESPTSPFASGKFRIMLTPNLGGNQKRLIIADGAEGSYKYSLIDISNNESSENRPVLDPVIIVGGGAN